jgi:hypothetical protein
LSLTRSSSRGCSPGTYGFVLCTKVVQKRLIGPAQARSECTVAINRSLGGASYDLGRGATS